MAKQQPAVIDWDAVEHEYVAGDDTVTAISLATKYSRHSATVRQHAAKMAWTVKRTLFRKQIAVELRQKTLEDIAQLRASRAQVLEDLLFKCIDHAATAFLTLSAGSEMQNAATALGIAVDKYHKQIGHDAQAKTTSEEEAGERITIERWRHLKNNDVFPA